MATSQDTLDFILDQLAPLPITFKKMFGEYALYLDGKIPAFITNDTLGVKITDFEDERLSPDLKGEIYPSSKDYWLIPGDYLEDRDWIQNLIIETNDRIPLPKPKKPKTPKSKTPQVPQA